MPSHYGETWFQLGPFSTFLYSLSMSIQSLGSRFMSSLKHMVFINVLKRKTGSFCSEMVHLSSLSQILNKKAKIYLKRWSIHQKQHSVVHWVVKFTICNQCCIYLVRPSIRDQLSPFTKTLKHMFNFKNMNNSIDINGTCLHLRIYFAGLEPEIVPYNANKAQTAIFL